MKFITSFGEVYLVEKNIYDSLASYLNPEELDAYYYYIDSVSDDDPHSFETVYTWLCNEEYLFLECK